MIDKKESTKINTLRFICIIFLVLLHTQIGHLLTPTNTDIINIQNIINIPFLPILFFLSGYLFFQTKEENKDRSFRDWIIYTYIYKIRRRIRTLLIPYILWCLIAIVYNHFIKNDNWPCGITNFLIQFWDSGSGHPIGKAMWYIKTLILFSFFSPVYYILIKYLKNVILLIALFLFSFNINIDYPFFNIYLLLGSYTAIMGFSLDKIYKNFNWKICLILYLAIKILNLSMIFPTFVQSINFMLCSISLWGIITKYNIPASITMSSSFIYFVHPYFTGLRNIYITHINTTKLLNCCFVWIITAISVLLICYILFRISKRKMPKIISILIGDRL